MKKFIEKWQVTIAVMIIGLLLLLALGTKDIARMLHN